MNVPDPGLLDGRAVRKRLLDEVADAARRAEADTGPGRDRARDRRRAHEE